jgi:hypothetical protein
LKLMDVPWHLWRRASMTNRSGDTQSPPDGSRLLMAVVWHQGQARLQDQEPSVSVSDPG